MNLLAIVVFLFSIAYIYISFVLTSAEKGVGMFLDYNSIFIVFVGSFIAIALSVDLKRVFKLFKVFLKRFFFGKTYEFRNLIMEVMTLTEAYRKGDALNGLISNVKDPFLKESVQTVSDGIVEGEELVDLLISRNENSLTNHETDANMFRTMAKFPPAFGMIGTTMGMIALLANLGGEDAMKTIGPAMAVALITTLYGAILANLVLLPIAENLTSSSEEEYEKNKIIIEGVKLLTKKTNPVVVAEKMNSFLPSEKRLDWKEVMGS